MRNARVRDLDEGQSREDEVHRAVSVSLQGVDHGLTNLFLDKHPALAEVEDILGCFAFGIFSANFLAIFLKDQPCWHEIRAEGIGLDTIIRRLRVKVREHAGEDYISKLGNRVPS